MKTVILILLLISTSLLADIPQGYYDGTEGLFGDELKAALNNIIDNHTELSYDDLWDALPDTDEDPDNSNNVIQLYTGWSVSNSGYPIWNREHVWAKSHGDFGDNAPCGTDLHHLRPTHPDVNSARGNKDFDNGGTQHSIATGCYYDNDSWEPRDEVKGDVARMIFYMATRYEGENGELDLVVVNEVNTSPAPEHGKLSTLLEWNSQDPPDAFEIERNDRIYENWQDNRNPFVDHPEFVENIWGDNILSANFTADETLGNAPLTVNFTDLSQSSAGIISWSWDLDGDGWEDSAEQNPAFTYQENGEYDVTLTIEVANGNTDSETKNNYIEVTDNTLPIEVIASSFETGLENWTTYSSASSLNWERSDITSEFTHPSSVPDGSWYMYMNNYNGDIAAEDWLISPSFSLANLNEAYCVFQAWTKFADTITGMELKVTTSFSGNPNTTNWNTIITELPDQNSDFWESSGEVNLIDYIGAADVRLAFFYTSTGTGANTTTAWAIDEVAVIGISYSAADNNLQVTNVRLQNYPNPFNPSTRIYFEACDSSENARIEIFNLKGQAVRKFSHSELYAPGRIIEGSIVWNGTDLNGNQLPSGIYLIQLLLNNQYVASKRCLLLK